MTCETSLAQMARSFFGVPALGCITETHYFELWNSPAGSLGQVNLRLLGVPRT